jgi:hypothetical protein
MNNLVVSEVNKLRAFVVSAFSFNGKLSGGEITFLIRAISLLNLPLFDLNCLLCNSNNEYIVFNHCFIIKSSKFPQFKRVKKFQKISKTKKARVRNYKIE